MKCNHTKKDGSFVCPNCYADLSLSQEEIDARDDMFLTMKEVIKYAKKEKEIPLDRQSFDYFINRNGARVCMRTIEILVDEKIKPKKEKSIMDIEKEKLKILKQIRDKL